MKHRRFIQLILLLVVIAVPMAALAGKYPQVVKDYVGAAKKAVPAVTIEEFKAAMDNPDIWIIDVREPNEYAAGHIRSAINIPRGVIEFKIWKKVGYPDKTNMDQKMYLYCKAGSRCALAAKALRELGFTEVYRTDIKMKEWVKAGNELVK
ncbi:MAG: rhodanese-like domain-containing protein [Gammaproteobacteria bacterium]|nr:rhodanese-like domain-containing protein [Gammaproteobacteria bacterium]